MFCCLPVVWASQPMYNGTIPPFILLPPCRSVTTSFKPVSSSVSAFKSGVESVMLLETKHDSILTFPYWPIWE